MSATGSEIVAMWWLLTVIMPCVAAWFVTKLMNQGDFDPTYFLASLSGALMFPFVAAFLSWDFFGHAIDAGAFYDLKPRCAGAFIGGLFFDAVKTLRA
jgi:asparagine N-glycosylation enzyme membrane subunit Stt3